MLLKDFNASGGGLPSKYIEHGSFLYFVACDGNKASIYRTDGNIVNTIAITSNTFIDIWEFEIIGNQAFFSAFDAVGYWDLYVHDLTPNTSATKININNTSQSQPTNLVGKNGRLYFNAFSGPDGFQICSIDTSTYALHIHILPPPYHTSQVILRTNRAYEITGEKSLVELNGRLIFVDGISDLFTIDLSNPTATPTFIGFTNNQPSYSPYVFKGKVYMNSGGDLISSDGITITTELVDVGPYYFMEYQNHLYFAGEPSSPTNTYTSVLYSIDTSGVIQEFPTIPTFGGTTVFNRLEEDYGLVILNGELHSFINPFPNTTPTYGIYKIDTSIPSAPTTTLVLDEKPKEMFNIEFLFGHYYYWYLPFQTSMNQLKKKNLTNEFVVATGIGDTYFKHFH